MSNKKRMENLKRFNEIMPEVEGDEFSNDQIMDMCLKIMNHPSEKSRQQFYELLQDMKDDPDYIEWQRERDKAEMVPPFSSDPM